MRTRTTFVLLAMFAASPAAAQTEPAKTETTEPAKTETTEPTTKFSGEVRLRDEVTLGLFNPADPMGDSDVESAHMRSRVQVDAKVSEHVSAIVQLQDVRTLGAAGSTVADAEGVDLKRGMIVLSNIGGEPISLEVGRFVMFYGDQRLIGHLEWLDQGRTFDGGRARLARGDVTIDVFAARMRETLADEDDQTLFGTHGEATGLSEGLTVQVYALGLRDGLEAPGENGTMDTTLFVTTGGRAHFAKGAIDATAEAAMQVGELRGDGLLAFAGAFKAGYTATNVGVKPRVGVELTFASGDGDPTDGDSDQFQTMFPTNHLHYGYADLAGWTNHIGARLSVSVAPTSKLTVTVDGHHLRFADPAGGWVNAGGALVRPGDASAASDLGNEVDLTVSWKPTKGLAIAAGWSYFMAGGFIADTGGGDDAQFGYAQAGVTF